MTAEPDAFEPPRRSSGRDMFAATGAHRVARHYKELYALLRTRLLVCVVVMFGFWGALPIGSLVHMYEPGVPDGVRAALIFQTATAFVIAAIGLVIWLRPPIKLSHLRALELVIFGLGLVILALTDAYFVQRFGLVSPPIGATRHPVLSMEGTRYDPVTLRWFVFIIGYGTLVPNTLRRGATICFTVSGLALTLLASQALYNGVRGGELVSLMIYPTLWMVVACVVSVFGSYRVSLLERRVEEIERLGQYRLQKHLGRGGMGDVYLAEHVLLKQPFAVKLLSPDRLTDPRQLQRFEREVQAMARLEHWNTVEIYDYGHGADGSFYYVMEYLQGLTLEELLWKTGPLPPSRAIHFVRQICSALHEAHGMGLLHRDIKPANVIACERAGIYDVAKLLDFGLVKDVGSDDANLTVDGHIAGTPAYMSPEQAAGGEHTDARSDIYSLGAVAFFLLTRKSPFAGKTAAQMVAAHIYEAPPSLRDARPDVDQALADVVARCLAKKPADRFASVAELSVALSKCSAYAAWTQREAKEWWAAHDQPAPP